MTESGPLLARVRVPEGERATVRVGDQATVVRAWREHIEGDVVHAAPASMPRAERGRSCSKFAGARRLPGANVTVRLGDQQRQALTVPREAVSPEGYVLVMQNGRTHAALGDGRRRSSAAGGWRCVSGLSSGERVRGPQS